MPAESHHDAFFKEIFSQPENAAVELRTVLPPALSARIDWGSLRLEPGSFVEVADASRFADLLFSADINGDPAYLYLLFEHQSAPHNFMPLRMLGYMVRKWEQCLRDEPRPSVLPLIIPVVLHHGEGGWKKAVTFHELFDEVLLQGAAREFTPSFRFVLDDLSLQSDAELLGRATLVSERIVPIVLWALRDGRSDANLLKSLPEWLLAMSRVREAPTGRAALLAVFRYIGRVTELLSPRAILTAVQQVAPETKEIVMTLAEHWLQEGFEKGIEKGIEKGRTEGIEKGIEKGRTEGERGILARLVKLKFGAVPEWALQAMANASEEQLLGWADRVLSATSMEEVFAEV